MPLDSKCGVEARTVVLPGADSGHLNDDIRLEVLAEPVDKLFVDGRRRCRDPLCIVERELFRVAELRSVAPCTVDDSADLGVADAFFAAPGSVEILSEGAADDRANPQVEQMTQLGWRPAGAPQPA